MVIELAKEVSKKAHENQVDKMGEPYYKHPFRVAQSVEKLGCEDFVVATAYLHDVVEDTEYSFDDLAEIGFPEEVISLLRLLTRESNKERYVDYIRRVETDANAAIIKLADLEDNMAEWRQPKNPSQVDIERQNKYQKAKKRLENKIKKESLK